MYDECSLFKNSFVYSIGAFLWGGRFFVFLPFSFVLACSSPIYFLLLEKTIKYNDSKNDISFFVC